MFDSLKKKLQGWISGGKNETEKKPVKKTSKKSAKKKETKSKKAEKIAKPKTKKAEKIKESPKEIDQKVIEEPQQEEKPEKKGFFARFAERFKTEIITEEQFDAVFPELEMILLENNVALDVVDKIQEELKKEIVGKEVKKDEIEETIAESLKNTIKSILIEPQNIIEEIKKKKLFKIVFFGINGSGKTTSLAKLAYKLKEKGISCVLAAGDTFRAAAVEQLERHGKNLGIEVIKQNYGADPAAVAFDAIKYAEKNHIQCVLIDTAGRMYTKENLIREMEKVIRIVQPDLKIFVGEAITGNDAVEQAKTFNEAIGIDGIILTKSDVDDKGGAALSVSYITKKPIMFLGTGQEYKDFQEFNKEEMLKHLGFA